MDNMKVLIQLRTDDGITSQCSIIKIGCYGVMHTLPLHVIERRCFNNSWIPAPLGITVLTNHRPVFRSRDLYCPIRGQYPDSHGNNSPIGCHRVTPRQKLIIRAKNTNWRILNWRKAQMANS